MGNGLPIHGIGFNQADGKFVVLPLAPVKGRARAVFRHGKGERNLGSRTQIAREFAMGLAVRSIGFLS